MSSENKVVAKAYEEVMGKPEVPLETIILIEASETLISEKVSPSGTGQDVTKTDQQIVPGMAEQEDDNDDETQAERNALKRKATPDTATEQESKKTWYSDTINISPDDFSHLKDLNLPANFFETGKTAICTLDPSTPAFELINTYINRSRKQTGDAKVISIMKIMTNIGNSPKAHEDNPKNIGKLRKMLWHGTQTHYVENILKEGLQLPKNKKGFFGEGIYFSDSFAYSLQYCGLTAVEKGETDVAYVFLSDVLLGDIYKSHDKIPEAPQLKVKIDGSDKVDTMMVESVLGLGWRQPDIRGEKLIEGCIWPIGKKQLDEEVYKRSELVENEYVIYETSKVIPKYLIKVEVKERTDCLKW